MVSPSQARPVSAQHLLTPGYTPHHTTTSTPQDGQNNQNTTLSLLTTLQSSLQPSEVLSLSHSLSALVY